MRYKMRIRRRKQFSRRFGAISEEEVIPPVLLNKFIQLRIQYIQTIVRRAFR